MTQSTAFKTLFLGTLALAGASVTALAGAPVGSSEAAAAPGVYQVVASGTFEGRSDHETSGTARILQTDAGYELRLGADFSLDGAPAPSVGFIADGEFTRISGLQRKDGAQFYRLPEGFTPTTYAEVSIWCDDFSIPLGNAVLSFGE